MRRIITMTLLAGLVGCEGAVSENLEPEFRIDPGTPESSDSLCTEAPAVSDPAPMRRLSAIEVQASLRDLTAELDVNATIPALPVNVPDTRYHFTNFGEVGELTTFEVSSLLDWAEVFSAELTADPEGLLGCPAPSTADDCVNAFVTRLGELAFRRPFENDEFDRLIGVYNEFSELDSPVAGLRGVTEILFLSPDFWYLTQNRGDALDDGRIQLEPFTVASRLSYFLWGSMPDSALRDAARNSELG
ncbi:MAG: DUF1595 domain-containing protein, partial [Myxococcota bacterium]